MLAACPASVASASLAAVSEVDNLSAFFALREEWDELPDDVKRLLGPAGEPKIPRPRDEY